MSAKVKYPRAEALKVAKELCELQRLCERLVCAGSLRRRKLEVGDVEILFIPKFTTVPDGLFDSKQLNLVDVALEEMLKEGILAKRKNVNGSMMWGEKNKLAVHVASGIPVDFFAATEENWFNYLVCRTGGAENNRQIAVAANAKGWKWNPYGTGFTDERGQIVPVFSEREVFELVGLPYKEPWERV
jgi:DNA polymerase/3'-5' exonuclease PolX